MTDTLPVQRDKRGVVILNQGPDPDFIDMLLGIDDIHFDEGGWANISASATDGGSVIGLSLVVRGGMCPGSVEGDIDRTAFYREGAWFLGAGPESDRLLSAIAGLYRAHLSDTAQFSERAKKTSIALQDDPQEIRSEYRPAVLRGFTAGLTRERLGEEGENRQ